VNNPTSTPWLDQFVLSRDLRALGRHSELVSLVRRGELVPVIRGVYRHASDVTTDPVRVTDDAFLARVRATQVLSEKPFLYCGFAAAAVWGLPVVGIWPKRVSILVPPSAGGRSNSLLIRTSVGHPAAGVSRGGVWVTSLSRTVVDIGRTASFSQAVAMADAALSGSRDRDPASREALLAELATLGSAPGRARCRGALEFADGASGSTGESVSRVAIRLLALPPPMLQVPFTDSRGLMIVDFFWPELGLIGEFDGYGKYLREEFTHGRSVAEIVMDEKTRENRLRALGFTVVRWDWPVARSLANLRERLAAAGMH